MSFLFERDDFPDLVTLVAERRGIPDPAIVEKDYYVTEALRIIARDFGDVVIFKGGTSLSKGWDLIYRFSEDIDLYVAPAAAKSETRARFEAIANAVDSFSGFTGRSGRSDKGSSSWVEEFTFETRQPTSTISPNVLLEAGIQSANQPTESRPLISLLAQELNAENAPIETRDRNPFDMELLHFRRTFVEKLFTIHTRVEMMLESEVPIERYTRHYYDLAMLIDRPEVQDMLRSEEYALICSEYRDLTERFYSRQAKLLPENMNLSESSAIFPTGELRRLLSAAYTRQCDTLCYGDYPQFEAVLAQFEDIRAQLAMAAD